MFEETRSLSFDAMVHLYDETRVVNPICFQAGLDNLAQQFPPGRYAHVLEPGIGTGRIAIPLGEKGYRVTGADISVEMVGILKRRMARSKRPLQIAPLMADATELPFGDARFDMVVAVDLLRFIRDWKTAVGEMLRVIKPGNPLVLMHTGTGMEIPQLNTVYRKLCAWHGHLINDLGAATTAEVLAHLKTCGCRIHPARERWRWTSQIRVESALNYLESRAYSFTISTPPEVHLSVMQKLERDAREHFGSLAVRVEVPNQLYYVVVTK